MIRCTCAVGVVYCPDCKGSGFLTRTTAARLKKAEEIWCRCGNPSGHTREEPLGSMTCWDCIDCGGVVQIG